MRSETEEDARAPLEERARQVAQRMGAAVLGEAVQQQERGGALAAPAPRAAHLGEGQALSVVGPDLAEVLAQRGDGAEPGHGRLLPPPAGARNDARRGWHAPPPAATRAARDVVSENAPRGTGVYTVWRPKPWAFAGLAPRCLRDDTCAGCPKPHRGEKSHTPPRSRFPARDASW